LRSASGNSQASDKVEPAIYAANVEIGDCWATVYLGCQHSAFHGINRDVETFRPQK
jgi:hypothetical protein